MNGTIDDGCGDSICCHTAGFKSNCQ